MKVERVWMNERLNDEDEVLNEFWKKLSTFKFVFKKIRELKKNMNSILLFMIVPQFEKWITPLPAAGKGPLKCMILCIRIENITINNVNKLGRVTWIQNHISQKQRILFRSGQKFSQFPSERNIVSWKRKLRSTNLTVMLENLPYFQIN